METWRRVYLGLGSNLGDRRANLVRAMDLLRENSAIQITRASGLYETAPVGYVDQPWFFNAVVEGSTLLTARNLLEACLEVERRMGRVRNLRWGPRIIDIDILLYEDEVLSEDGLRIPHPRMSERLFVLVPLAELYPDWRLNGRGIDEMIESLVHADGQSLRRIDLEEPWISL